MDERLEAWGAARVMVQEIVDQHGLEDQKMGGPVFRSSPTITKVDQHLQHIVHIADWLLNKK